MPKDSATVSAAWIGAASVVIAAIIGGTFMLINSDSPTIPEGPSTETTGNSSPAITVSGSKGTTVIVNPTNEEEDVTLSIDGFVQILDHEFNHPGQVFVFDVSLRNPSDEPISVSEVILRFDRELDAGKMFPASVETVSGMYVVQVAGDDSTATGPIGKVPAYAWYPYIGCQGLIVKAPVSQKLLPTSTDRFRLAVLMPPTTRLRGPLDSVIVNVT